MKKHMKSIRCMICVFVFLFLCIPFSSCKNKTQENTDSSVSETDNSGNTGKTKSNSSSTSSNASNNGSNAGTDSEGSGFDTISESDGSVNSVEGNNNTQTNTSTVDWGGQDFVISGHAATEPTDTDQKRFIKSLEDKYNCKFVYNHVDGTEKYLQEYETKTMAGEKCGDIIYHDVSQAFPSLAVSGLVVPIDSYFDFSLDQWNHDFDDQIASNGKHYGITSSHNGANTGIFFNKTIFERYGVKSPYEYYAEDAWTWDNFLASAQALTKDTDGDQATDLWGFAMEGDFMISPSAFVYSNGGHVVKTVDGNVTFALGDPQSIEGLQFGYDLAWKYHVVDTNGNVAGYWAQQYLSGHAAMLYGAFYNASTYVGSMTDYDIGFICLPKGNQASGYINVPAPFGAWFMSPYEERPADVGVIWSDYLSYKSDKTLADDYSTVLGDETGVQIAVAMSSQTVDEQCSCYDWLKHNVLWMDMGISSQTSPQAFVDSVKIAAQKSIDDTWTSIYDMD